MKLPNLSVKKMIVYTMAAALTLMGAIGVLSMLNAGKMGEAISNANKTAAAVQRHMDSDMMHEGIRADVFAAFQAARDGNAARLAEITKETGEHVARLHQDIADNEKAGLSIEATTQAGKMQPVVQRYGETAQSIVYTLATSPGQAATQLPDFERDFSALEQEMEVLSELILKASTDAEERAQRSLAFSRWSSVGIVLFAVLLLSYLGLTMYSRVVKPLQALAATATTIRSRHDLTLRAPKTHANEIGDTVVSFNAMVEDMQGIVREIRESSLSLVGSSQKLSTASDESVSAHNRQSEALTTMASAMEELSVGVDSMSENAHTVAQASAQADTLAQEGTAVVGQAVHEMKQIAGSVQTTAQAMEALGAKTEEITKIVQVIKDIADQTNLLALNAAIEAARAGEQGRGFAVVADEVRKLAERTGKSTEEIARMVGDIQAGSREAASGMEQAVQRVHEGELLAEKAGGTIGQVSASAAAAASAVAEITNSLREQSAAGQSVARNVEQVAQMAEQSTLAASEAVRLVQELMQTAGTLEASVSRFQA